MKHDMYNNVHSPMLYIYTSIARYIVTCFHMNFTLTVVSYKLLPTSTAVSTPPKMANRCNSHFIHCTTNEVADGV